MLRPLILDTLQLLGFLCLVGGAFFLGARNSRWPIVVQCINAVLAVAVVILVAGVYAGVLPIGARWLLHYLGGPKVVLSAIAVFLLGIAWHAPRRSFTPSFLRFLIGVAALIVLIEGSGRVYWRYFAADPWTRFVDASGCLNQSTSMTCGPTAAVMLLHFHGITASEGELAYLSATSFFGTDALALAQAVDQKARSRDWSATFQITDYEHCLAQGLPFIATVRTGGLYYHAVFVEQILPGHVIMIDPGKAHRQSIARTLFEEQWNGEAVHIVTGKPAENALAARKPK